MGIQQLSGHGAPRLSATQAIYHLTISKNLLRFFPHVQPQVSATTCLSQTSRRHRLIGSAMYTKRRDSTESAAEHLQLHGICPEPLLGQRSHVAGSPKNAPDVAGRRGFPVGGGGLYFSDLTRAMSQGIKQLGFITTPVCYVCRGWGGAILPWAVILRAGHDVPLRTTRDGPEPRGHHVQRQTIRMCSSRKAISARRATRSPPSLKVTAGLRFYKIRHQQ